MSPKNNSRAKKGFGKSNYQPNSDDDSNLSICSNCRMYMKDDMPRGLVLDGGEITGVMCISCSESASNSIRLGTPKNPYTF